MCIIHYLCALSTSSWFSNQSTLLATIKLCIWKKNAMILLQCGFRFLLKKKGGVLTCILDCHIVFRKRTLDFPSVIRFALSRVIQQIWTSPKPWYMTAYNKTTLHTCFDQVIVFITLSKYSFMVIVKSFKLLDVWITADFSSNLHVDKITTGASKRLYVIHILKRTGVNQSYLRSILLFRKTAL